jgi:NTE family protein
MSEVPATDALLRPRIALALSGGGLRAALFHLGVLLRAAEAGWLPKVDVLSTVSGGSIVGAFAAIRWGALVAEGADVASFRREIIEPFLALVQGRSFIHAWVWRLCSLPFRKLIDSTFTRTSIAADLFGAWFYGNALSTQLPSFPYLVINASNLVSGRAWRFTRDGLGDSRIGYAHWGSAPLPLGFAVGASSAFPPAFPPARVNATDYVFSGPIYGEPVLPPHRYVPLTDGGVYENLGVEVLTKSTPLTGCTLVPAEFLVVSDASRPAQQRFRASGLPALSEALLSYRVDEIARDQVCGLRRRMLVRDFQARAISGTLVVLGSSIAKLPSPARQQYIKAVGEEALIPADLLKRIHGTRTHLDAFTTSECEALMYHGYTLLDSVLFAHGASHRPEYRIPHPGEWRITFTPEKIREWKSGIRS